MRKRGELKGGEGKKGAVRGGVLKGKEREGNGGSWAWR